MRVVQLTHLLKVFLTNQRRFFIQNLNFQPQLLVFLGQRVVLLLSLRSLVLKFESSFGQILL